MIKEFLFYQASRIASFIHELNDGISIKTMQSLVKERRLRKHARSKNRSTCEEVSWFFLCAFVLFTHSLDARMKHNIVLWVLWDQVS